MNQIAATYDADRPKAADLSSWMLSRGITSMTTEDIASLHGASHQAAQEFQVATSKAVPDRRVGRSSLRFLARSRIDAVPVVRMAVAGSLARVSTVGATMLDVAEDLAVAGGLDGLANVAVERGGSPSYLSPTSPKAGTLDSRWNIILNKEIDPDI